MRARRSAIVLIALLAGLPAVGGRAAADTYTYSTVRRQIRCGIVVSRALNVGNFGSENPDPHVFFVADARTDLKPLGMEFVNPLAPAVVTSDIYSRWQQRVRTGQDPAFVNGSVEFRQFRVGNPVTKNMGAYWEVNVDNLSAEELSQYDLLLMTCHQPNVAFSADVREKFRRFMDSGGTLWIDQCGGFTFANAAPFMYDVQFSRGNVGNPGTAVVATPNHPLLTYPYILSQPDVAGLGDKGIEEWYAYDMTGGADPGGQMPSPQVMVPIVWNTRGSANQGTWRPYILGGQVGAGHILYTAQDSGCAINDYVGGVNVGYGGNSAAISGTLILAAKTQDLKLLYNMASWNSAQTSEHAGPRRQGSTGEKMGAALAEKWADMLPWLHNGGTGAGTAKVGGAVQFRNCVYAVDGQLVLHCYDAKPGEDLDGDGNADEGKPDLIAGAPWDEIWSYDLKPDAPNATGASTPVVIEFTDPNQSGTTNGLVNFRQRELVIVTLSDGTVEAFRALPRLAAPANQPLAPFTNRDWFFKGGGTAPNQWAVAPYPINTTPHNGFDADPSTDIAIPSPAWSEGVIFVDLNTTLGGKVIALEPFNGHAAFQTTLDGATGGIPNASIQPPMPPAIGTPTVGYVQDSASGAIDKVVYAHVAATTVNGLAVPESLRSFWFGTKGEPLVKTANNTVWLSRATNKWYLFNDPGTNDNPLLRQHVFQTYRDPNGAVFSKEFTYVTGGATATLAIGQYAADLTGNQMKVYFSNTQTNPAGGADLPTDDERFTYYADYTVDWSAPGGAGLPPPVSWRNLLAAPFRPGDPSSRIGGPPGLGPNDSLYYAIDPLGTGNVSRASAILAVTEQTASRSKVNWAFTMHDGFQLTVNGANETITPRLWQLDPNLPGYGQAITQVQFFGTPAFKDNVIFAVAHAQIGAGGIGGVSVPATVLCAFRANPDVTLHYGQAIAPGTPIQLQAPNLATSTPTPLGGTGQGTINYVQILPPQYTIDYEAQTIHITSMAALGSANNFASNSLPFLLQPNGGTQELIRGVQTAVLTNGQRIAYDTGPTGVDNLLWYLVIPVGGVASVPGMGFASSSPMVQGDIVWLGFQGGYMASFDADPTSTDPQAQTNGGQVRLVKVATTDPPGHLRSASLVFDPVSHAAAQGGVLPAVQLPPGGTTNVMAVNTMDGVRTFEDAFTIIADNKRLIEVNAAGDATWSSDSTRAYGIAGGALAQYVVDPGTGLVIVANQNATGVPVGNNVPYNRPSVARRIGTNDLIVVDTGNNRVMQIDRGANVIWEVSRLQDDFKHLLRPGDPMQLNEPTDVQYWVETNPALAISTSYQGTTYTYNGPATIVHYLIADSGNYRVIELVDIYDNFGRPVVLTGTGGPAPFNMLRQVNFASSSGAQGRQYRYHTVQRIVVRNGDLGRLKNPALADTAQRLLTLSAVANARVVGGGPVESTTDDPLAAGNVDQPESVGGSLVVLDETGNPLSVVSNLRIPDPNAAKYPNGFRTQPIVNPASYSAFMEFVPNANAMIFKYLLADDNGVYQMAPGVDAVSGQPVMNVEWLLSANDYFWMTGKRLRASSVVRLTASAEHRNPNAGQPDPIAGLRQFLITNRWSGQDDVHSAFGVTYNNTGSPANGNISGPSEFGGEAFVIKPTTFNIALAGADLAGANALHGYAPDYMLQAGFLTPFLGTTAGSGGATVGSSIIFRTPVETLPAPPNLTTGFVGEVGPIRRTVGTPDRATSSSVLQQPAYADRPF